MTDIILGIVILLILGFAISYIVKAKKSGAKCIGCPDANSCSSHKEGLAANIHQCNCSCHKK